MSFNELLVICIDRINLIAEQNNVTIISKLPAEIIKIYGDEEKLSRAITNVISNCIRYANSLVTVELTNIDKIKVQLIISDDGPGFKNNELPNIFERFYKGVNGNLGLGLSISKNIIEKLHGQIFAKNTTTGALFIVELPINFRNPQ